MQISFDRLFAKNLQFFFAKLVQFFFMLKAFQKAKFYQNLTKDLVCYRKKHSFRQCAWGLRQLVLKPGCGYVRKVRKFQQPQTNTFWVMQKKLQGGSNWPPPTAGIGLKFRLKEVKILGKYNWKKMYRLNLQCSF